MLLPRRCAACHAPGPALCATCFAGLEPAPPAMPPPPLHGCSALLAYAGPATALVLALKRHPDREVLRLLGRALADLAAVEAAAGPGTVVTWAPTSPARRRRRGYDQAELLARAVARACHLPVRAQLQRAPGPAQHGAAAPARRAGPTFRARGPAPPRLLLVDDVLTTGSTLSAAATTLRAAGVDRVHGLVVARVAAPHDALKPGTMAAEKNGDHEADQAVSERCSQPTTRSNDLSRR